MTDLTLRLREELAGRFELRRLELLRKGVSHDGTVKYLWSLSDGARIESVAIPTERKITYCLSSQVGCPLGCRFCATGAVGFTRDLSSGEILEQLIAMLGEKNQEANSKFNVVFMGMGEPLLNYEAVLRAVGILIDPVASDMGRRRVTISTAGVTPQIERLCDDERGVRLAVSLNATDDETRSALMPINRRYPIGPLIAASRRYGSARKKRVSFEYVLIKNVNDRPEDRRRLRELFSSFPVKINIIPLNAYEGLPYPTTSKEEAEAFAARLREKFPYSVTVRKSMGKEIGGACGQLAAGYLDRQGGD